MPTHLPLAACFDLETTAPTNGDARDPEQAIPVQTAVCLLHPAGHPPPPPVCTTTPGALSGAVDIHTPRPYPHLINPGVPITDESAQVHGITDEDVIGAEPEDEALDRLRSILGWATSTGYVLIAANAHYDLTVLDRRMRAHYPHTPVELGDITVMDPMIIDRWADKYRKGKRTLGDLAEFYAVPLAEDEAHDAGADAQAAGLVTARILDVAAYLVADERMVDHPELAVIAEIAQQVTTRERFRLIAQMGAAELHTAQITWRAEWAQGFQTWLRHKAPADRRDPEAIVNGAWPLIPAPSPAT